jgi:hypothetical protein
MKLFLLLYKIHLQFCKEILGVRTSSPNFMVYGELGSHQMLFFKSMKQQNNFFFFDKYNVIKL